MYGKSLVQDIGYGKSKYCEGQGSAKEYLARSSIERTLPNYSNEALCTLNLSEKKNKQKIILMVIEIFFFGDKLGCFMQLIHANLL